MLGLYYHYWLFKVHNLVLMMCRYCPLIDGVVAKGTSVLMAPVRGRGGTVVGVLIAAKPITEIANSSKKRKAVQYGFKIRILIRIHFCFRGESSFIRVGDRLIARSSSFFS